VSDPEITATTALAAVEQTMSSARQTVISPWQTVSSPLLTVSSLMGRRVGSGYLRRSEPCAAFPIVSWQPKQPRRGGKVKKYSPWPVTRSLFDRVNP
jgi:hypothetical protein